MESIRLLLSEYPNERRRAYDVLNVICNRKYCLNSLSPNLTLSTTNLGQSGYFRQSGQSGQFGNSKHINSCSSIARIKSDLVAENMKMRNSPTVKEMRVPVAGINAWQNRVLTHEGSSSTLINQMSEQRSLMNRSMMKNNQSVSSSQYFKPYNSIAHPMQKNSSNNFLQADRKVQSVIVEPSKHTYKNNSRWNYQVGSHGSYRFQVP